MPASPAPGRWRSDLRADLTAALTPWLVSRALVAVAYVVARLAADQLEARPVPLADGLFAWDGSWYLTIADNGYAFLTEESLRFFPLYPVGGRIVGMVLVGRSWLGLIILANVGALVAAALIRRLTLELTGDEAVATRATWLLLLAPICFVLVWSYSEPVFLVAAIGALLALHRRAWWWVAGLGAMAALTRPVGVLLALAVAVELLVTRSAGERSGSRFARAAAVAGPVLGVASYLLWAQAAHGDWQAPMGAQTSLRGEAAVPLVPLVTGVGDVLDGRLSALLHLGSTALFVVLIAVVFRRLPRSHGVLAAATFLVATSAERLTSLERYTLSAVPVVIAAAILIRRPAVERVVLPVMASAMVGLTVLAWLGVYTP